MEVAMSTQLIFTTRELRQRPLPLVLDVKGQTTRRLLLVRFTAMAIAVFALLILAVVATARVPAVRLVIVPARRLLPGSVLPGEAVPLQFGTTLFFQVSQDG